MLTLPHYDGKIAAVLGLSRTGLSACRALVAGGGRVWAWDDDYERRKAACGLGVSIVDLNLCNWDRVESLILSPGIPLRHPKPHRLVKRARAAGVRIIGDMELLAENQLERRIVGITGTNGKSTTSALIAHVLDHAGIGTQLGGNIGLPVLDLLPKPVKDIYVLELSSYQLDLTERLRCAVAVILNVSPDHLDRHGGMTGYLRAKKRILRNQEAGDWAVIGIDDDYGRKIVKDLRAVNDRKVVPISATQRAAGGIYVADGHLIDDIDSQAEDIGEVDGFPHLKGAHNGQNIAAAYAVARAIGAEPGSIIEGMASFPGLAHRLELVNVIDGIVFVNDSKATNPDAAARALATFENIYWIAGGQPKQDDLDAVLPYLGHVKRAYLIGEAAERFQALLDKKVATVMSGTLEQAFQAATDDARKEGAVGATVLLAPASASFDQFPNFEARGDAFRHLVDALGVAPDRVVAASGGGGSG
ncbi:MAG: UDP-N-acetylmuramoyl-L-alanine--D-glutamate ligase [Pseudomonadota bacterium]